MQVIVFLDLTCILPSAHLTTGKLQVQYNVAVINHRITEQLGLEETSKIIKYQPPCHKQGCQPLGQVTAR